MVDAKPIDRIKTFANVSLVGILDQDPRPVELPPTGELPAIAIRACELPVRCNGSIIIVRVLGEQVELLDTAHKGDIVEVKGRLRRYEWNIGHESRERLVVECEALQVK